MTVTARGMAKAALLEAEGCRLTPYRDTEGHWTIGRGHKLPPMSAAERTGLSWTLAEADAQFDRDLRTACLLAESCDWFAALSPPRQAVIIEMTFQLGLVGVRKFTRMIAAIESRDWAEAARQIRNSKAGREQTPRRYRRLAQQMRTGEVV